MPSGAKKRKAAKKKKENQNQPNNHSDSALVRPHGDEDLKQQDDRESDVGEMSSPTSQDHQKLPIKAEIEVGGKSSMEGSRIDNGEERVGVEESVVVQVEKEIKIEDELGIKDGIIEHDEANRKSYYGGSSGSSGGSSSDDESHGIKEGQEPATSIASVGSVEVPESLSGKSVETVCDSLTAEAGDSVVESISSTNSEKMTVFSELVAESNVAHCVVESTLSESGEKKFGSVEERISTSVNAASYRKEEANARCAESTPKTLDPKECVAQENDDDRSASPCIAPRTAVDGARHVEDSVVTQPVVAPSPYPVQKTSWKSCCGLFEVVAGSGA